MKVSVGKLEHHPLNEEIYSLSNIDDLVHSIEEVGLLTPLVIDKSKRVISGNRRLVAIKKLGLKRVEVDEVDIKDREVVPLIFHHNKPMAPNARHFCLGSGAVDRFRSAAGLI